MKRIQFILNNRSFYGANRSILSVIEDFISKGHKVKVLVPFWGSMADTLKEKDISYEVIPFYSAFLYIRPVLKHCLVPFLFLFNIIMFPYLLFRVNRLKPDIIYSNTSAENIGIFIAKILSVKHVWHIREFMSLDHNFHFLIKKKAPPHTQVYQRYAKKNKYLQIMLTYFLKTIIFYSYFIQFC